MVTSPHLSNAPRVASLARRRAGAQRQPEGVAHASGRVARHWHHAQREASHEQRRRNRTAAHAGSSSGERKRRPFTGALDRLLHLPERVPPRLPVELILSEGGGVWLASPPLLPCCSCICACVLCERDVLCQIRDTGTYHSRQTIHSDEILSHPGCSAGPAAYVPDARHRQGVCG